MIVPNTRRYTLNGPIIPVIAISRITIPKEMRDIGNDSFSIGK